MGIDSKVTIFTLKDLSRRYGSTFRPLWQVDGLRKNNFNDFQLCSGKLDNYSKLVHAHQDAIYHVGCAPYLADLHSLGWLTDLDSIDRLSFSHHKLVAKFVRIPRERRKEEEAYKRAKCLICAAESIADEVEHLNRTEVVRNAVALERYTPTTCKTLRVAVVGPFAEGHENMYALQMLFQILKLDKITQYLVIGPIGQFYVDQLSRFSNVTVEQVAEDFISTLRSCSVLLSPYPDFVWNGFGGTKIKVIEAAACSLAIVGTQSGIADFNETSVLYGNSPGELVDRIRYLTDDKARQRLGERARRQVEQFHNNINESKKLISLYRELS